MIEHDEGPLLTAQIVLVRLAAGLPSLQRHPHTDWMPASTVANS